MRTIFLTVILVALLQIPAGGAVPEIARGGVSNHASLARTGALNAGIAQGSLFRITGTGLGPADPVQSTEFPLKTELGGSSVTISASSALLNAYVLSVAENQIVALLPSETPVGSVAVTVTFQGRTSAPAQFPVVRRNFAAFSLNDAGTGPAIAHVYDPSAGNPLSFSVTLDQPLVSLVAPAAPNQTVTIWGTGLGAVSGEAAASVPGSIDARVSVYVGGVMAPIRYAGRADCCAGIDQIVFAIPRGVDGCYVPVQVVGPGLLSTRENLTIPLEHTVSNSVTISVSANGSPCTDAAGLSGSQLSALQDNRGANIAAISLIRRPVELEEATRDTATARVSQFSLEQFLRSRGIYGLPSKNSCVQYQLNLNELESQDSFRAPVMDSGPALRIEGPNGTREMAKQADGSYAAYLGGRNPDGTSEPGFLRAGSYTVSATGGADTGPFEAKLNVPEPPIWTNKSLAVLANSFSPALEWTGADSADYVLVAAYGRNDLAAFYTVCTADPASGGFTIPRYTYAGVVQHTSSAPNTVWIGAGKLNQFQAPGLDFGFIHAMIGTEAVFIP